MIPRLIRRTVTAWVLWRADVRSRERSRLWRYWNSRKAALRSQHKAGGRKIEVEKRRLVTERLRTELGIA